MKTIIISVLLAAVIIPASVNAQSSQMMRVANKSFSDAESDYKKGNYREAATNYETVMNIIPKENDSRRSLMKRLDANAALIDIYFNYVTNFELACRKLEQFYSDMEYVKRSDVLRGGQLYDYVQLENDFEKYKRNCRSFRTIETDKQKFEKIFEEEFKID